MKGITWINLLVGLWLIIAPFALLGPIHGVWTVNDVVLGVLLIGFSWWIIGAVDPPVGTAWFELLCGVWLIIAPFVLGYRVNRTAVWNDVLCGIIAAVVALISARELTRSRAV